MHAQDDNFISQITAIYRDRIPAGGAVLDLMSSHVSHLPKDVRYGRVIGHGMNAEEVSARQHAADHVLCSY